MGSNNTSFSFGRYLQAIRLEKKISLEEISEETRIRMDNLLLIEKEDHENLPAPIFVKGFLRAYAKAIGADADETIRRYEKRHNSYQKVVSSEANLIQLRENVWPSFRFAIGVVFCLIVLSMYAISTFNDHPVSGDKIKRQTVKNKVKDNDSGIVSSHVNSKPVSGNTEETKKKLLLEVITVKETWMKVIIDGQSPEKFSLNSGDRLEFEAFTGFNLLLGDAKGVKLTLNNEPYNIVGENGQMVNIQIP